MTRCSVAILLVSIWFVLIIVAGLCRAAGRPMPGSRATQPGADGYDEYVEKAGRDE